MTNLQLVKKRQISLIPMATEQFESFMASGRSRFVAQTIASGAASFLEAEKQCDETLARVLPQGHATPNQFFRKIYCSELGYPVGSIWYGITKESETTGYIYDFAIDDRFQRQGYGGAVMEAVELEMRSHGFEKIRLHVFGNNIGARRLYDAQGFHETNVYMEKRIDTRPKSKTSPLGN